MFRNILKNTNYTQLLCNTMFKNTRSISNYASKEQFLKSWSTLTENSRKLIAITESSPNNAEILLYRGHAQRESGEYFGAIESYREAAAMDKEYKEKAMKEIDEIQHMLNNHAKCK